MKDLNDLKRQGACAINEFEEWFVEWYDLTNAEKLDPCLWQKVHNAMMAVRKSWKKARLLRCKKQKKGPFKIPIVKITPSGVGGFPGLVL